MGEVVMRVRWWAVVIPFPCRREAYVVFTDEQETNPGAWERRATTLFLCP